MTTIIKGLHTTEEGYKLLLSLRSCMNNRRLTNYTRYEEDLKNYTDYIPEYKFPDPDYISKVLNIKPIFSLNKRYMVNALEQGYSILYNRYIIIGVYVYDVVTQTETFYKTLDECVNAINVSKRQIQRTRINKKLCKNRYYFYNNPGDYKDRI
jgi:mRNA-degrading endonuclease HigB of HigAB toxin-antitoxin module